MEIRQAEAGDCPEICALWNTMIRDTVVTFTTREKRPGELARTLDGKTEAGQPFLLARDRGALLGFTTYGQFRNGPGYVRTMESTIMIEPGARGKGLGRRLMHHLERHASERGIHSIFAGVSAENEGAAQFHRKCGFQEVACLREVGFKFGRWHDLILLQKFL